MSKPKLCAIDIDGTLVTPQKIISAKNASAIAQFVEDAGTVVLASGRMHSSILPFAIELELPVESIILSYNGGMARTVSGNLLFERPVPAEYGAEIVEFCRLNRLHLNFYISDTLYVRELDQWSDLYLKRSGSESAPIGDLSEIAHYAPTKLIIIDSKEVTDRLAAVFQDRYRGKLNVTKTDDEYLEFMASGVDKGAGLKWVSEKLGISRSDTIAFGDSYNDIQMIEWAGIGVAMSNGRDEAKAAADVVADNELWEGVGNVLAELSTDVER